MATLDPALEHARAMDALLDASAGTERAARHAEQCACEWLAIARRLIREVDADLARRARQLCRRR